MSLDSTGLRGKNLVKAREMLFKTVDLLEENGIPYHLEGGTLLGIVRDKELLPWDHDVDVSVPVVFANEILNKKWQLLLLGYKVSVRKSGRNVGPIKAGQYALIKIKPLWEYFTKW